MMTIKDNAEKVLERLQEIVSKVRSGNYDPPILMREIGAWSIELDKLGFRGSKISLGNSVPQKLLLSSLGQLEKELQTWIDNNLD